MLHNILSNKAIQKYTIPCLPLAHTPKPTKTTIITCPNAPKLALITSLILRRLYTRESYTPDPDAMNPQTYNAMKMTHATIPKTM
jgi:hypothetical protein